MYSRQWACCIVGSLMVMTVIGCYSHYPSSIYGPGGYQVQPGGAYPQGGSYVLPPGATIDGSGASLGPAGTYESQSPSADGSSGRWQPGGNAAPYDPSNGGINDNPVPDYNDPAGNPSGAFDNPGDFQDTNEFGGAPAPGKSSGGGSDPMAPLGNENSSPFGDSAASADDDAPFTGTEAELTPIARVQSVSETSIVSTKAPSPYKYDRQGFKWLRGVVDYDGEAGNWNIIYNIEPDRQDQYGGSIVLSGVGRFEGLQSNDVVLVEGAVDPSRTDDFGKPKFRVDKLVRLEPLN